MSLLIVANLDIIDDNPVEMICILIVEGAKFAGCMLTGRHLMGTFDQQPKVAFFPFFIVFVFVFVSVLDLYIAQLGNSRA